MLVEKSKTKEAYKYNVLLQCFNKNGRGGGDVFDKTLYSNVQIDTYMFSLPILCKCDVTMAVSRNATVSCAGTRPKN